MKIKKFYTAPEVQDEMYLLEVEKVFAVSADGYAPGLDEDFINSPGLNEGEGIIINF